MQAETALRVEMTPQVFDGMGHQLAHAAAAEHCGARFTGAGGGGVMMIFVDPESKPSVEKELAEFDGSVFRFQFVAEGAMSWTI